MADDLNVELPLGEPDEVTEVVEELAPDPTPEPEPEPEPQPEPQDSPQAIQARENAALRQYMQMLEERVRLGQPVPQAPPPPPDFFQHMTPEQKTAWQASVKELQPVLDYREQQMRAYFDQRLRQADQRGEVAEMRAEYGDDFRQMEGQLLQVRQQIAQQGGGWLPLGDLYLHAKGQQAVQAARTGRNAATQAKRKPAAQAARATTAAPAGIRAPQGRLTAEQVAAMSDDDILNQVARQSGIERLTIKRRA